MFAKKTVHQILNVAALAAVLGTTSVYAQSSQSTTNPAPGEKSMTPSATSPSAASPSSASPSAATSSESTMRSSGSSASTGSSASASINKSDRAMMRDLAYANLAEIEAGKMAQSKAQSEDVKEFAQKMVDDHSKAMQELQQLAMEKGVTLPTETDKKHQATLKKLSAMSGNAFDKQYLAQGGLRDHKETQRLLKRVQTRANDPQLKELATNTLPTIEQHMELAQQMHRSKGSMKASGASGTASPSGSSSSSGASDASGSSGSSGATGTSGASGAPGSSGMSPGATPLPATPDSSGSSGTSSGATGSSGASDSSGSSGAAGSSGAGTSSNLPSSSDSTAPASGSGSKDTEPKR